ncbi:MAG: isoprenylcysteine carboxylmethyltransferase family protein [Candidatus Schekmanbacteria bacterium]|nr:isoprenylcysteine carboxylmethyltransferase family protein [Candidatus Schekmanbacteria bacterium]
MRTVAWIAIVIFPASEIALAFFRRARPSTAAVADRNSLRVLWMVIAASVVMAIFMRQVAVTELLLPPWLHDLLVAVLIGGGMAIRWVAILSLGRMFTVDVAVQRDHALVETGVYRHVRHPSYTGLLVAFLGLGVYFANWLSLGVLLVPIGLALANRIAVEEAALARAFGPDYAAYRARTKRLLPGLF